MTQGSFFGYFVARRIAGEMDSQGPPSRALQAVVAIPAFIVVVGLVGLVAFGVGDFLLWKLGFLG
ncbi:MAG: hypothetical protein ACRYHQ_25005 [Janthinobacterium lividum]